MKKFAVLTALIMTVSLVSCTSKDEKITVIESSETVQQETVNVGELDLTVFDVGKADSMVLTSENSTVIIDCGEKGDGKEIIEYLEEKNISSVDYLIITHYDKDHVGGAAKVINNIEVKNVLAPDYDEESEEMDKYNKALSEAGITPKLLTGDLSFTLDNAEYTVYAPKQSYYGEDNDNDFSLVTKITHGNNVLLFTGDAMEQRLEEIMDIGDCDFLKVPYHGRSLDNLDDFLSAVTPEKAVVCTSKSEFSADTQKELINRNIEYYATCFNGKIEVKSDGNNLTVTAEKG